MGKHEWHKDIDEVLDEWFYFSKDTEDKARSGLRDSEQMKIVGIFLEEAAKRLNSQDVEPSSEEAEMAFDRARTLAEDVIVVKERNYFSKWRLTDEDWDKFAHLDAKRMFSVKYPAHYDHLIEEVIKYGSLQTKIDPERAEEGILAYLNSDVRHPCIDRELLILTTDYPITQYIEMMETKPVFTSMGEADYHRIGLVKYWLQGLGIPFAYASFFCILGIIIAEYWDVFAQAMNVGRKFPNAENISFWAGYSMSALSAIVFIAIFLITGVPTLMNRKLANQYAKTYFARIAAIQVFYPEFRATGPFSVPYFRTRLNDLRQLGFLFPQSTWALLDDIEERGILRL